MNDRDQVRSGEAGPHALAADSLNLRGQELGEGVEGDEADEVVRGAAAPLQLRDVQLRAVLAHLHLAP